MYAGNMSGGKQCAYVGAIMGFSFGGIMVILGIVWLGIGAGSSIGDTFTTLGGILLAVGLIILPCAVGLCWYTCRKTTSESYPQGPIVSGSAPPGPVTGFGAHHAGYQQGAPQAGAYPSAPTIRDDMAPPPRYDDLIK